MSPTHQIQVSEELANLTLSTQDLLEEVFVELAHLEEPSDLMNVFRQVCEDLIVLRGDCRDRVNVQSEDEQAVRPRNVVPFRAPLRADPH